MPQPTDFGSESSKLGIKGSTPFWGSIILATTFIIGFSFWMPTRNKTAHKYEVQRSTSMSEVVKHKIMTKLIDDLELKVLKSTSGVANVYVNGEDLLILIEYTRQLEAVIQMMDGDPSQAKQLYKH